MRHWLGSIGMVMVLAGLTGCPGGDDGTDEVTGAASSTGPAGSSTGAASTSGSSSGGLVSTGPAESSSSGAAVDSSSSSSGGAPVCELPVVGEWNACVGEDGEIDNTLCNWIGDPDGTGFLTCLSAPPKALEGGNVCTIRGCRDTCDCFEQPATGTAAVVCAEILSNGETACGLDCSSGETCPDGMECASGLCFWPPA
jgi:hypothetical protein